VKKLKISADLASLFEAERSQSTDYALDRFGGYARKLQSRQYVYKRERYMLWQKFEIDPAIRSFNCRVTKQPVPMRNGQAGLLAPDAVTLDSQGHVCVHVIFGLDQESDDSESSGERKLLRKDDADWDKWAKNLSIGFIRWSLASVSANAVERVEMTRLLRFVSFANRQPNLVIREKIIDELVSNRYLSIRDLLDRITNQQDIVLPEVADLILDGKVFSDISVAPFSLATCLSVRENTFGSL
jgi:hypothetical protein